MWAIAIHGGAGNWDEAQHEAACAGVRVAAREAGLLLARGGVALDAATAAVTALEEDRLFNAGTGSVLNRDGEAEMDAAVMTGYDLAFGAVAAIRRVRNPVLVARRVMERSGHALLAGEGAVQFARACGFDDYDPVTAESLAAWKRARAEVRLGTVGAVALDRDGRLAAATSTGGTSLKLPGRVGDTPLPGAGTYATRDAAASATGKGELVMRVLATKRICDLAAAGLTVADAVKRVLEEMRETVGAEAGFIAVGRDGSIGIAHGTRYMAAAWWSSERTEIVATMTPSLPSPSSGEGRG
jgi:beta-aspartyl-peptidase (threonine type)